MNDREYMADSADAAPRSAARRFGGSALLRTAVFTMALASLGLTPAVASAGEAPGRLALAADHGIQSGYVSQAACEADRLVFRHYGLSTAGCYVDSETDRQWYFYWVNP